MPGVWSRSAMFIVKQANCFQTSRVVSCGSKFFNQPSVLSRRGFTSMSRVCFASTGTKTNPGCWKCGVSVDLNKVPFCKFCEVVQKPDQNADFFKILLQKRTFDIKLPDLTKKFRLLQMQLHPDRFSQKTEDEKLISACYSSLVNQAYKTLLSPVERGLYLLELEGYPLKEGEVTKDLEFFQEIMDINEELDSVENKEDLKRMRQANIEKLNSLLQQVSSEFNNRNWEAARELMAKIKFYDNIQGKIKNLEQQLDIDHI